MNGMYNPFANGFNYPQSYPQFPQPEKQQPIQNIFTNTMPNGTDNHFMAQFLKDNESVENMPVIYKTAFIDLKNKELKIKDVQGNVTSYGLILPKDEKDEKIEELEKQKYDRDIQISNMQNELAQLREMITNESKQSSTTISKNAKQSTSTK